MTLPNDTIRVAPPGNTPLHTKPRSSITCYPPPVLPHWVSKPCVPSPLGTAVVSCACYVSLRSSKTQCPRPSVNSRNLSPYSGKNRRLLQMTPQRGPCYAPQPDSELSSALLGCNVQIRFTSRSPVTGVWKVLATLFKWACGMMSPWMA